MTYTLYIGDKTFSSWSLRGWLMFRKFNIPAKEKEVGLYSGTMADDMAPLAPARLVPTMQMPDGTIVGDSLAMAETLAENHPQANMWPNAPDARATARWLVAEMHTGFGALRDECPMQLQHQWIGFEPSDATRADLDRLQVLWQHAARFRTANGPWLFGEYSLADVFYAPVAARIAGYDLQVGQPARDYVMAHLSDGAFQEWRFAGLARQYDPFPYPQPLQSRDWPA